MSFLNDTQRGAACAVLTDWIRGAPWFIARDGDPVPRPTKALIRVCETSSGGMSTSEFAMLLIAYTVFTGRVPRSDVLCPILQSFDRRNQRMVGELLVAIASPTSIAVDMWLARWGADDARDGAAAFNEARAAVAFREATDLLDDLTERERAHVLGAIRVRYDGEAARTAAAEYAERRGRP